MSTEVAAAPPALRPRDLIAGTIVVALAMAWGYFLFRFRDAVIALFLGIVLATALRPAVDRLQAFGVRRIFATLLTFLVLGGLILGGVASLAPSIARQAMRFVEQAPGAYDRFHTTLKESNHSLVRRLGRSLPAEVPTLRSAPAPAPAAPASPGVAVAAAPSLAAAHGLGRVHAASDPADRLLLGPGWRAHDSQLADARADQEARRSA